MNLIIDIGNSFIKLAIFDNNEIVISDQYRLDDKDFIHTLLKEQPTLEKGIISITGKSNRDLISTVSKKLKLFIILDEYTPLPIENLYSTKDTLGKDRLAAAVAANYIYPERNILVIDAGTALTYEVINKKAQYLGGGISPGLAMRFKALNAFTDKLPLLYPAEKFTFPASTTTEAIQGGVQNGIIKEIESIINDCKKQYSDLKVVFTGGDAVFFDKKLKNSIFVDSNLVLKGLNRILEFNAENF